MKKYSLLVGNGINNIGGDNSWDNLITEISKFCKIDFEIDNEKKKQFPLLYEEIFLHAARKSKVKELALKQFIAKKVSTIYSNQLHEKIRSLKTSDIITTNYEFSLEGETPESNEGVISEKLYSVFRHYISGSKRIWHVHGDCLHAASINLGFEHYGGQLQHVRNYTATGASYESRKVSKIPFIRRLAMGKTKLLSWIDLFFTTDIHIIGLTLGFVETDLWWLLTFRARKKIEQKNLITNQIIYYIPEAFVASSKNKLDLFRATDVKVVAINKTGEAFYNDVLARIARIR